VLDPVKLVITNWDALHGAGTLDACSAPLNPHDPEQGRRHFQFGKELWIERSDYEETPPKGFHRLYPPQTAADGSTKPGNRVRLKYGHVVQCTGAVRDAEGRITEVHAELVPDTKSGTPGADKVKVKGTITWVGVHDGVPAEVRLYDRLFQEPQPDAGGRDFLEALNPRSVTVTQGFLEPGMASARADDRCQIERHGYFVVDRKAPPGQRVLNRIAGLRDSWATK
jgi:glutaminyl-tRNA synthetase